MNDKDNTLSHSQLLAMLKQGNYMEIYKVSKKLKNVPLNWMNKDLIERLIKICADAFLRIRLRREGKTVGIPLSKYSGLTNSMDDMDLISWALSALEKVSPDLKTAKDNMRHVIIKEGYKEKKLDVAIERAVYNGLAYSDQK